VTMPARLPIIITGLTMRPMSGRAGGGVLRA
jgi:hypothetical protein